MQDELFETEKAPQKTLKTLKTLKIPLKKALKSMFMP